MYRCAWSDLDAAVYLSRWEAASQGFDAWRKGTSGTTAGDWVLLDGGGDQLRGSYVTWGETPSLHSVACYRDLPFCMDVLYPTEDELATVSGRFGYLDAENAAIMVSRWPDVHPWVALPEPE